MGLLDKLRAELIDIIEWVDDSKAHRGIRKAVSLEREHGAMVVAIDLRHAPLISAYADDRSGGDRHGAPRCKAGAAGSRRGLRVDSRGLRPRSAFSAGALGLSE